MCRSECHLGGFLYIDDKTFTVLLVFPEPTLTRPTLPLNQDPLDLNDLLRPLWFRLPYPAFSTLAQPSACDSLQAISLHLSGVTLSWNT